MKTITITNVLQVLHIQLWDLGWWWEGDIASLTERTNKPEIDFHNLEFSQDFPLIINTCLGEKNLVLCAASQARLAYLEGKGVLLQSFLFFPFL